MKKKITLISFFLLFVISAWAGWREDCRERYYTKIIGDLIIEWTEYYTVHEAVRVRCSCDSGCAMICYADKCVLDSAVYEIRDNRSGVLLFDWNSGTGYMSYWISDTAFVNRSGLGNIKEALRGAKK